MYELKSISASAAQRALDAGGELEVLQFPFFSGGHTYTHLLTTKRGTQYRISKQVVKQLIPQPA